VAADEPSSEPSVTATVEAAPGELRLHRPRLYWSDERGTHDVAVAERAVVGCAPEADVVIDNRTVSRIHAELEPRDDGVWVRDLGSKNGTYVNTVRVERARLPQGATLTLGSCELRVLYERAPVRVDLWPDERFGPLLGRSIAMRQTFARLAKIAPTESSVLIHGETGTGKELVAHALHRASKRASGPFFVVDCAALPDNLLEAELFGHAKGAFTGAVGERVGAIEAADGGTVFLDEIGELPLSVQPKLLRVLESREVRPLGQPHHKKVDVRFVSASHRDLAAMVNEGAFREDLYFRLAVLVVSVPPLRERLDDLGILAQHLLPQGSTLLADEPTLLADLRARPWLGNVRELRNFLERAHALGAEDALAMPARGAAEAARQLPIDLDGPYKDVRERWLEVLEREYVRALLGRTQRNVKAAAEVAGVDRTYLYRLIKKHDL
jgi:two-component system response regulator GlrR